MRIAVVLAILAVACSKKDEPPAPKAEPAPSSAAAQPGPPRSATPGGVPAESFVPETLLSKLGAAEAVVAVDFTKLDLATRLGPLIPDYLACVREMAGSAGILVASVGDPPIGYITKLPERTTKQCLATLGFNTTTGEGGAEELDFDGDRLSLRWRGDTAIVTRAGDEPVSGTLSKSLRAKIAAMPPNASAWIISEHETDGIASITVWVELSDTVLGLHMRVEGTRPGVARQSAEDMLEGIKEGAAEAGFQLRESWFKLSSTEANAAFDATIPLSALLKR